MLPLRRPRGAVPLQVPQPVRPRPAPLPAPFPNLLAVPALVLAAAAAAVVCAPAGSDHWMYSAVTEDRVLKAQAEHIVCVKTRLIMVLTSLAEASAERAVLHSPVG